MSALKELLDIAENDWELRKKLMYWSQRWVVDFTSKHSTYYSTVESRDSHPLSEETLKKELDGVLDRFGKALGEVSLLKTTKPLHAPGASSLYRPDEDLDYNWSVTLYRTQAIRVSPNELAPYVPSKLPENLLRPAVLVEIKVDEKQHQDDLNRLARRNYEAEKAAKKKAEKANKKKANKA